MQGLAVPSLPEKSAAFAAPFFQNELVVVGLCGAPLTAAQLGGTESCQTHAQ